MLKIIRRVAEWGISPEMTPEDAYRMRLTNILLLFMFFASILETIICYISGAIEAAIINSSAPFTFGSGLLLMRAGYTLTARLMVITISYTFGYAMIATMGSESYFQFIFLFASGFASIFFSYHTEKLAFAFGLIGPVVCFALLEATNYEPVLGMQRAVISEQNLRVMRFGTVFVIWTLMVGLFVYYVRVRRRTQEQLVSSAKMVAMGRMAAGIAHEINNPLQRISLQAEKLKTLATAPQLPGDEVIRASEQIENVVMRIGAIVRGLLALSRDASNDLPDDIPVHSIIRHSLDYYRSRLESHNIELRMAEVPSHLTTIGRETQLSEVLLNVMNNAYDAVIDANEKWIEVQVASDPKWIEIAVVDSGPGIPTHVRKRMFDPFFTTKKVGKGTGLGLSVSQAIMEDHGGQIYLDLRSQRTRFVMRMPRGMDA